MAHFRCERPRVRGTLTMRIYSTQSEVVLGGRRIVLPRLRARSVTGAELTLPSFAYASAQDPLDARTLEAIAVGVTTRKYYRALDPLPPGGHRARGLEECRVATLRCPHERPPHDVARHAPRCSRHPDRADRRPALPRPRDPLGLGRGAQREKHVLALRKGTTENATVCKGLLADLRQCGLDLDRPTLFIIDGGTGLRKALRESCGPIAVVHRCQVHKRRNVLEHLPDAMRLRVRRVLDEAVARISCRRLHARHQFVWPPAAARRGPRPWRAVLPW